MNKAHELHVIVPWEQYEKLRHLAFYEHTSISEILRRLIDEHLDEKALEEPEFSIPRLL
ncbi:MAG: ribbon-helix-helix protein, CopG family [Bacillota bacterium]